MFFSKKAGFHGLLLYIRTENESYPLLMVMPQSVASDVLSTMKKFEKSSLNSEEYLGNLGPFVIVYDIQDFKKIDIYEESFPWSDPILYTDFAQRIKDRLERLVDDKTNELEEQSQEELIYFIGEFTMMQDDGFTAPF